jgi:hypothetical protein
MTEETVCVGVDVAKSTRFKKCLISLIDKICLLR